MARLVFRCVRKQLINRLHHLARHHASHQSPLSSASTPPPLNTVDTAGVRIMEPLEQGPDTIRPRLQCLWGFLIETPYQLYRGVSDKVFSPSLVSLRLPRNPLVTIRALIGTLAMRCAFALFGRPPGSSESIMVASSASDAFGCLAINRSILSSSALCAWRYLPWRDPTVV